MYPQERPTDAPALGARIESTVASARARKVSFTRDDLTVLDAVARAIELSGAGGALVRRCAELGILVDLSHLNEAGFWDVARLDVGPLVASHSAAHALCPTSRNLTDAQLDAIAASDGLVGIVFACPFLRSDFANDPDTPLELIVAHARYVSDRIGVAHVALGSDFDGATIPAALGDVAGMPKLLAAFAAAGFSDEEIAMIAWKNWRRALARWWSA
jgi:membrane dipeptidase